MADVSFPQKSGELLGTTIKFIARFGKSKASAEKSTEASCYTI